MNIGDKLPLMDVLICFSGAVDMASPVINDHHYRVAFIAATIGKMAGLSKERLGHLIIAGCLHDVGAFSLKERLEFLNFEVKAPERHCIVGYKLLDMFEKFKSPAEFVLYHHTPWDNGKGREFNGREVPYESHIIHIADRIAVLADKNREILGQADHIKDTIIKKKNTQFMPELVEIFEDIAEKEYFWLDIVSGDIQKLITKFTDLGEFEPNINDMLSIASMFSKIIDFRSSFTATHSAGVASVAVKLAELSGFSEYECTLMKIAGLLHDIGKLAVPEEILEKPGKLTNQEFNIIKSHTYHSYRLLSSISNFDDINRWASFHHEHLNGSGYPFHLKADELPLGSRIMAVADKFTAIAEDRPYRKGMEKDRIIDLMKRFAQNQVLDNSIVNLLIKNYEHINETRITAQAASGDEYRKVLLT